jgi:hypothetical protein
MNRREHFAEQFRPLAEQQAAPSGYRIPGTLPPASSAKAQRSWTINAGSLVRGTFADLQACGDETSWHAANTLDYVFVNATGDPSFANQV